MLVDTVAVTVVWRGSSPSYLLLPLGLAVEEPVPDDRYHAIYFAMLLAGVGFLLPYNSFITDVDYLHHKYPGGPPPSRPASPGWRLPKPYWGARSFKSSLLSCKLLSDSGQPLTLPGLPATFQAERGSSTC